MSKQACLFEIDLLIANSVGCTEILHATWRRRSNYKNFDGGWLMKMTWATTSQTTLPEVEVPRLSSIHVKIIPLLIWYKYMKSDKTWKLNVYVSFWRQHYMRVCTAFHDGGKQNHEFLLCIGVFFIAKVLCMHQSWRKDTKQGQHVSVP